ncbi:glycine--tRNA ligase subunit beta [uncultured Limosilactobacillus sp.]|uniref:glycine--tRNA ligase subunit beta n=1 Tax=uncultured Limosilactobacillus sp. TaxID=2837629 RepID=UPI0025D31794|nr:glycine--tRNA ligase subunit beta [uncultured Limosilactobacillus sp.]
MANSYLLEVGVEEMPAHVVTPSIHQLHERVAKYLKEQRINFQEIKEFATPRRLALLIHGLDDQQPDIDESVKGPAKKIAQDQEGNWTKAAIGFTRGQGASVDDIEFKEVKGTEYVFVEKHITGKPVAEVLQGLPKVITAMNFPTLMKWGYHNLQFIRPIRWLVSLLNDEVVPFKILDVEAGRETQGHRFLGHPVDIATADDYESALHDDFVIADQDKRKALIKDQITEIINQHQWQIDWDADLLEEVNNLVEWPTAFAGSFDEKYLALPEPVLITSMKDNQRFFCLRDQNGKLLPHFISVRNGNREYLENVIKGNERVLVPRLEDAQFFYDEDQKITIDQYVQRLQRVSFHDQISSMADKMARTAIIADLLAEKLNLSAEEWADLKRAAKIYKFDLTTQMVGEFAELQGVMGEIYAKLFGEKDDVAVAIREHYMPTSAEGKLPQTKIGAILAIADKLDSIFSFFGAGMVPSGSNDPYALRRQAYGIVRIVADRQWHLPLLNMQEAVADRIQKSGMKLKFNYLKNANQVKTFFMDRLKQFLAGEKMRHDIIDTVTDTNQVDLVNIMEAADAINSQKDDPQFKDNIEALTRVIRIDQKGQSTMKKVDPSLFQNLSEKRMYEAVHALQSQFAGLNMAEALHQLRTLAPVITKYFDENMIMDKNEQVKNNRLVQLHQIAQMAQTFGNLNQLIVK